MPFFRAHAHTDSKHREPWLFSGETTKHIKASIDLRYKLLIYLYTSFREYQTKGTPIIRPLWFDDISADHECTHTFRFGKSIVVSLKPQLDYSVSINQEGELN